MFIKCIPLNNNYKIYLPSSQNILFILVNNRVVYNILAND